MIVDAIRTPIGRAGKGSLREVRADDLASVPLRALVERNPGLDFATVDDIYLGCGFQVGEQGYNLGRNAALLAGIDHHVPAASVNRFCASSLQTMRMAFDTIPAGEGDTYIAAGAEAVPRSAGGEFEFHPQLDGSEGSAYNIYIPMGADRGERRGSLRGDARGAGRVGRALPAAGGRRRRGRPVRRPFVTSNHERLT